ncbi:Cytokinin dehydrogenase 1, FAD and cytokinin binding [Lentzea xinjiangensis]|uniref:Cytokinin dehydrogenase 1, FAD and cytokinin binding n=1 Tax=Lentzea xinjiangensis TaxID=402600 RepID=A0A1H9L924_9PSEU|nr:FAD-binding protein [Lentzea xinjiangensis]SER07798.1 Cytokinin dehydrogenase 1, FAD and cytokinin binding [Lentzea xinjiangensis]
MHQALSTMPALTGSLDTDENALAWAAHDYGDTVHHLPTAVLRPANAADISTVIKHAGEHDLAVVPRGQGHSTGGQAQAPGGVVIDMTALSVIHEVESDHVVVDAGAKWSDVLRATLPHGLTPPVLTDYLELTVGGTLSVGGLGGASHHHGAQTDNVLSLDVVTPTGDVVTCSPSTNRSVFDAVRAGRGRNGVITRATLRLVRAPETVSWHKLHYNTIGQLIVDQRQLVTKGSFDYVEGQLKIREGEHVAELEAVTFTGTSSGSGDLSGMSFREAETQAVTYWDFVDRLAPGEPVLRDVGLWDSPHPWCNLLVPSAAAEALLHHADRELGADLYSDFGLVLAYPLRTDRITTPLIRLPDDEVVFLVAALRYAPAASPQIVTAMHEANGQLISKTLAAGGALYLDPL